MLAAPQAADRIARFARRHSLRGVVDRFVTALHGVNHSMLSVHAMVGRLRVPLLAKMARVCLVRLYRLCKGRGYEAMFDGQDVSRMARVATTSIVLYFYPTHVVLDLEAGNPDQHSALVASANAFFQAWMAVMSTVSDGGSLSGEIRSMFVSRAEAYIRTFNAWQEMDRVRLGERIRFALLELYRVAPGVRASFVRTGVYDALLVEAELQVAKLREKLGSIVGPQALVDFDAEHPCPY